MLPDTRLKMTTHAEISTSGGDAFAEELRGFGPLGILAIVVIFLVGK